LTLVGFDHRDLRKAPGKLGRRLDMVSKAQGTPRKLRVS
jgi:hypothetical protein